MRGPERKIDQLNIVNGHIGSGISARDPFGKLTIADLFRLEQRALAVVDMPVNSIDNMSAEHLVIGVGQLVIDDLGEHAMLASQVL